MRARTAIPAAMTAAAALLLVAACGIRPRPSGPGPGTGTIITAEEIAATEATTMWEALQRTVRYANFGESSTGEPVRIHRRGFSSISLTEDMPIYGPGRRLVPRGRAAHPGNKGQTVTHHSTASMGEFGWWGIADWTPRAETRLASVLL